MARGLAGTGVVTASVTAHETASHAALAASGQAVGILADGSAETALVQNQAYYVKVFVPVQMTFNRIGYHVVTHSSANVSVAIYAHDSATDLPTTQTVLGAPVAVANGRQLHTIASTTLAAGAHWIGISADQTATLTFPATRALRGPNKGRSKGTAYPLPDPAGSTGNIETGPIVWLEYV